MYFETHLPPGIANANIVKRHCGWCRFEAPIAEYAGHDCRPPGVKAMAAREAEQRRRIEAERMRPTPCFECGIATVPGKAHLCVGPSDTGASAVVAAMDSMEASHIASVLAKAGYEVVKKADA